MAELTLEMAEKAVKAAQAKARELGTPMTATVVDDAGRLVLSAVMAQDFSLLKLPVAKLLPRRRFDARPRTWRTSESRPRPSGAMWLRS
jgi:heme-degrading protein